MKGVLVAGPGRVAVGALIGAATAALFFEGLGAGPQVGGLPAPRPAVDNATDPGPEPADPTEVSGTLVAATSTDLATSTTTTTSATSTTTTLTSTTTTTTTAEQPVTTTTTTTTPPPPPPTTTTTRTTTTTTRRPCGILWCP